MADHLARAFVEAPDRKLMLRRLAAAALAERPPTGFRADFVLHSSGERRGMLDIKRRGLLPIESLARWSGLRAGVSAASTRARLKASLEAGTLSPDDATNLRDAFELFSALRTEHQVGQLREGAAPDDLIQPKSLAPLARTSLKEAFRAVARVQRGVATELRLPAPLTPPRNLSWRETRFIAIDVGRHRARPPAGRGHLVRRHPDRARPDHRVGVGSRSRPSPDHVHERVNRDPPPAGC